MATVRPRWTNAQLIRVLAGALILVSLLFFVFRPISDAGPLSDSYQPSGTRALYEIAQQQGVPVVRDRREKPNLQPGDLVIYPVRPAYGEDFRSARYDLAEFLQSGGRVIELGFPAETTGSLRAAVWTPSGSELRVQSASLSIDRSSEAIALLRAGRDIFVTAERVGKGVFVNVPAASLLQNRRIDQADHQRLARLLLSSGPPYRRIVFAEGAIRPEGIGLMGMIGPWAVAAWYQLWFFVLVGIVALGARLGLPIRNHLQASGGREFVGGLAGLLQRSRNTEFVLDQFGLPGRRVNPDAALNMVQRHLNESEADDLTPRTHHQPAKRQG